MDDAANVAWGVRNIIGLTASFAIGHDHSKNPLVVLEGFQLLVEQHLNLGIMLAIFGDLRLEVMQTLIVEAEVGIRRDHGKTLLELGLGEGERVEFLPLDPNSIHAVFTVQELDDLTARGTESTIVASHNGLHGLHQTTLDVTGLGSLTGGIDKTFATTHGVEEEFLRTQTTKVRVLDEASTLGTKIILGEVRKRTTTEAVGDTLSFNVLLSDTGNNLRNVDEGALTTGCNHGLDGIGLVETRLGRLTGVISRRVQNPVDELLETLNHGTAGLRLKVTTLSLTDKVKHLHLSLVDGGLNLAHRVDIGDSIDDANTETALQNPVVHDDLDLVHEALILLPPSIEPGGVDETAHTTANILLIDRALDELTLNDRNFIIVCVEGVGQSFAIGTLGRTVVGLALEVDLGKDERDDLLASPQFLWLEDGRGWNAAIPVRHPHEQVVNEISRHEHVALGHLLYGEERILHDTHDGTVRLTGNDDARTKHHLLGFGTGGETLRDVKVHLITIEIGIVRTSTTQVETEGGPIEYLGIVAHDTHLVKRRLTIE